MLKLYILQNGIDQRIGICAGGTGSFIDQMVNTLKQMHKGLNMDAKDYKLFILLLQDVTSRTAFN